MHQFLMGKSFITLAIVTSVNESGEVVSVKPMVEGFTGGGDLIPNSVIHGVPVWRLQRGASAVIMPPVEGDIGLIAICDRDITAVKKTKQSALPGSNRTHSYSDAIYLGGVLNAEPSQYVKFANDGIDIVSPLVVNVNGDIISINAESRAEINAPEILLNGQVGQGEGSYGGTAHFKNKVTSDVDFQAGDISLVGHRTSGVQSGTGTSGTPIP
ncbi:Gp138 family membrane-puncturing spike protein [Enterobacter ludwigii]